MRAPEVRHFRDYDLTTGAPVPPTPNGNAVPDSLDCYKGGPAGLRNPGLVIGLSQRLLFGVRRSALPGSDFIDHHVTEGPGATHYSVFDNRGLEGMRRFLFGRTPRVTEDRTSGKPTNEVAARPGWAGRPWIWGRRVIPTPSPSTTYPQFGGGFTDGT